MRRGASLQAAGGSTSSIACRSRHSRSATSRAGSPTSSSRDSGGTHRKLKACSPTQGEQARAAARIADDVVVGERIAVIAVGDWKPRSRPRRVPPAPAVRPGRSRRQLARQARTSCELGQQLVQRCARRPARIETRRKISCVLDELGAGGAQALHHQVEAVGLVRRDAVIVDRRAQIFARARRQPPASAPASAAPQRSVRVGARPPLQTRTTRQLRPPFSKYCSTA